MCARNSSLTSDDDSYVPLVCSLEIEKKVNLDMKSWIIAAATAALVSGAASAEVTLQNGDFEDGTNGWNVFGGHGHFDYTNDTNIAFDSNALATWGDYGGGYSGAAQNLGGDWNVGDTINFGADVVLPDPSLWGDNYGFIVLNFFGSDNNLWWGHTIEIHDEDYSSGPIHSIDHSITLDLDDQGGSLAYAARLEMVLIFRQPSHNGDPSGAIIFDNAYATTVPAPGALALLGLAGIASRRRRN